MNNNILILDFGGQYASLIARRVREAGVYCEIHSHQNAEAKIRTLNPSGIILSGGPQSVYKKNAPSLSLECLPKNIPVLGICYGAQLLAFLHKGLVTLSSMPEYGTAMTCLGQSPLFTDIDSSVVTWMSHTDCIAKPPNGFEIIASTKNCSVAGMQCLEKNIFALQFHPEVTNTKDGFTMIKNFLFNVCKVTADWKMDEFLTTEIDKIRAKVGDKKVILGLSGGVDSSVCAAILSRAIGSRLSCVFVDHGLMRKYEADEIEATFSKMDMNFIRVNASERFFDALKGVKSPERKRKVIGAEFIKVFEEEAAKIKADLLAQGTIYPDVIESGSEGTAVIKSHHNVGGLPKSLTFKGIIEPLKSLFKDEVRKLGKLLLLKDAFVQRQPFPGPGLGIRVIGEVTRKKVKMLADADYIFTSEITKAGLDKQIHQFFAVLTNVRSVGVMGDSRTYGYTLVLRGVTTSDFMTADYARIPDAVLSKVSARIVNEVKGITRVVYDITTKPPATIEWE